MIARTWMVFWHCSLCGPRYECRQQGLYRWIPAFHSLVDAYSPNWIAPHVIPFDIKNDANVWSATVSLICFEAVEWHPTDKIRRQFDFYQESHSKL
ncbi:hypothetical protein Ahy_A10g047896 [Arachis hypogaea]|uniref:Aminotransferase-like plant mobile domain-containing protein n=1 Tax=Arachis hypogaea TaxID=3818 RepID=A0A445B3Q7_ARAHY|nr:hypothetical protein Ahy_A10g047896 [Arachis hypogaea]